MKSNQIYESVTNTIIDLLKKHQDSWDRPWVFVDAENRPARNPLTRHQYTGINQFILSATMLDRVYPKNTWGTFKQIQNSGGHVIKGEKSVSIIFYKPTYRDKHNKIVSPERINNLSQNEIKTHGIEYVPILRSFNVFNLAQTEGLSKEFYKVNKQSEIYEWEKDQRAESLLKSTNANIEYKSQNRAYYNPAKDVITLPVRSQFKNASRFYSVALHELAHWTGSTSRLNRSFGKFGSPDYGFEELIAELTSAFLCSSLGFSKNITNNAAYIKHWLSILKKDHKAIFKAAASAQKASDFVFKTAEFNKGFKNKPASLALQNLET